MADKKELCKEAESYETSAGWTNGFDVLRVIGEQIESLDLLDELQVRHARASELMSRTSQRTEINSTVESVVIVSLMLQEAAVW